MVTSRDGRTTTGEIVATGTVKWFDVDKGYGFILPDGGGEDIFVAYEEIASEGIKTLLEGQAVTFEISEGRKGPQATNIRITS